VKAWDLLEEGWYCVEEVEEVDMTIDDVGDWTVLEVEQPYVV